LRAFHTTHVAAPLVFDCFLRPQVWGGRRLASFLNTSLPTDQPIGEAWVLSGHPLHVSQVSNGPASGVRLADLCEQYPRELMGDASSEFKDFPWLVKFLDCHDLLSVQVHPSDELALRWTRGERGKTEAWVVLDVEPGSAIFAGLKFGVTRSRLERALDDGTVTDCLHRHVPRPGDCFFLPAGTIHAVGGGVLMAEVQQTSDATFRLYDWNRPGPDGQPRKLHRTEALACIDWSRGPVRPQIPQPIYNLPTGASGELLIDCPQFRLSRYRLNHVWRPRPTGRLCVWIVLDGQVEVSTDANSPIQIVGRGGAVLIPSVVSSHRLRPLGSATLLHVTTGSPELAAVRITA